MLSKDGPELFRIVKRQMHRLCTDKYGSRQESD